MVRLKPLACFHHKMVRLKLEGLLHLTRNWVSPIQDNNYWCWKISWWLIRHWKKTLNLKIVIFWFSCDFCFQDDRVELSKEFDASCFKMHWVVAEIFEIIQVYSPWVLADYVVLTKWEDKKRTSNNSPILDAPEEKEGGTDRGTTVLIWKCLASRLLSSNRLGERFYCK
jgi:hypothetical protein